MREVRGVAATQIPLYEEVPECDPKTSEALRKPVKHGNRTRVNILEAYRHEDDAYEADNENSGHDDS